MSLKPAHVYAFAGALLLAALGYGLFLRSGTFLQPRANVAGYLHQCADGTDPVCRDVTRIKAAFNLDPFLLMEQERGRMAVTARKIMRGEILDDKSYRDCISSGTCVEIPLPKSKNPQDVQAFQHLVDKGTITADLCRRMKVCGALVRAGLFAPAEE